MAAGPSPLPEGLLRRIRQVRRRRTEAAEAARGLHIRSQSVAAVYSTMGEGRGHLRLRPTEAAAPASWRHGSPQRGARRRRGAHSPPRWAPDLTHGASHGVPVHCCGSGCRMAPQAGHDTAMMTTMRRAARALYASLQHQALAGRRVAAARWAHRAHEGEGLESAAAHGAAAAAGVAAWADAWAERAATRCMDQRVPMQGGLGP